MRLSSEADASIIRVDKNYPQNRRSRYLRRVGTLYQTSYLYTYIYERTHTTAMVNESFFNVRPAVRIYRAYL
jgi:hypothetical protein